MASMARSANWMRSRASPHVVHGFKVEGHHLGSRVEQFVNHVQRRGLADVVRFWLEGQSPQGDFDALQVPAIVVSMGLKRMVF